MEALRTLFLVLFPTLEKEPSQGELSRGQHIALGVQRSLRSKRFRKVFRTFEAFFVFLAAQKLGRAQKSV